MHWRPKRLHLIRKADKILATIHSMEQRSITPTWDELGLGKWCSEQKKPRRSGAQGV